MRTYPADSPQAVARVLALVLLADGNVSKVELDVIDRVGGFEQVGLERDVMETVLQNFCEDLQQAQDPHWSNACQIDPRTVDDLLAEIEDPVLRVSLLRLCIAVAAADNHVADGEVSVLVSAAAQWGLNHEMLNVPPPNTLM
jgi:uncharacterized tellurite resistance protein B-like protein